ncbi:MAG: N-6 DNA methylase [Pseudonocardiaceae bacterium]
MPRFAIKEAPAGVKLRGGYYTPQPVARFIARWVSEAGSRLLEPACGDGAILGPLVEAAGDDVVAVELLPAEATKASRRCGTGVTAADFFSWFTVMRHGSFDGVAGNPPYIRFGSWEEAHRAPALALMESQGMRPTRLTNAWVPFVVASVLAVRPGGRVGLVLPAELLQVGYAAALRSYLVDSCSNITVVSFQQLLFPGIQQEVVLLLAEVGPGPAAIRTVEVSDAAQLSGLHLTTPSVRARLHETEKWTKYYLDTKAIEVLRAVRADARLSPLRQWAEVDVGVVTGRNGFFCMTAEEARERGLANVTVPLVSRSQQVPGLTFTTADLEEQDQSTARTRLLVIPDNGRALRMKKVAAYVAAGEADGIPTGYKCRIRRNWWQVPSVWIPDGFMLRQISTHPRLSANLTGATSTDTVHRVRVRSGADMASLATAAYNSATFALSEVIGRSYGGGILELEPSEAEELPVPDPALVPPAILTKADDLIRERRVEDALDLVDQTVLIDTLGIDPDQVAACRSAWIRLRDRRISRK